MLDLGFLFLKLFEGCLLVGKLSELLLHLKHLGLFLVDLLRDVIQEFVLSLALVLENLDLLLQLRRV